MFTYNFRRLLNLIGMALFQKLLKALKDGDIEAIKAEIAAYIAHCRGNNRYFFELPMIFRVEEKNYRYVGG